MGPREVLTSTCRHCRRRVIFTYLPRLSEGHDKAKFRIRAPIWFHRGRELGEELHCDESDKNQRAEPREYCVEFTGSGSAYTTFRICNRPVKDYDLFMCGIHARVKREDARKREQYQAERELSDHIFSSTLALQGRIEELFGLSSKTEYDWREHAYTGKIAVNPRELLDLLERMSEGASIPEEEEWEDFV